MNHRGSAVADVAVDRGALAVARNATLGDRLDQALLMWLVEDQIALYEWARSARRPFLNTAGATVADMWVYPSRSEALAFLSDYRQHRHDRFETGS